MFGTITMRIARLQSLQTQRISLKNLDDSALRDIGISRAEAEAEARRPVWDAPHHWKTDGRSGGRAADRTGSLPRLSAMY